ncbi:purine-nucleoside phosphorylase [Flammeovirgaceae bacterium SG7u.111]|nr:purine-nucleoside phosphorylase [Flammeovirgaceae bacterium SG7u.132]WPO34957.1 purine-nucleoside phosphorylase [Flammeovirgaceae bacterium SG7u.111]
MTYKQINEAASYVKQFCQQKPVYGIILGTGLGALVDDVEIAHEVPYEDIPNFPTSTVESHSGKLIIGLLSGKPVIVMQGRFHYYEGYNMKEITLPVRVMKLLGVEKLIVSNAAGALNPSYQISDIMVIDDHINMHYENPLTGKNLDEFGPRFPDMSEPYDQQLLELAQKVAKENNITIRQGVYVSLPGPNLETKAEYKFMRVIGADAVGMSTVPEVIAARHMDMPVFALSVLTDLCSPGKVKKVDIKDVLAAAAVAEPKMTQLIKELIKQDR